MRRRRCRHCGELTADHHSWDARPCALGRSITVTLCRPCDVELNRLVLQFLRVRQADRFLEAYKAR